MPNINWGSAALGAVLGILIYMFLQKRRVAS